MKMFKKFIISLVTMYIASAALFAAVPRQDQENKIIDLKAIHLANEKNKARLHNRQQDSTSVPSNPSSAAVPVRAVEAVRQVPRVPSPASATTQASETKSGVDNTVCYICLLDKNGMFYTEHYDTCDSCKTLCHLECLKQWHEIQIKDNAHPACPECKAPKSKDFLRYFNPSWTKKIVAGGLMMAGLFACPSLVPLAYGIVGIDLVRILVTPCVAQNLRAKKWFNSLAKICQLVRPIPYLLTARNLFGSFLGS